VQVFIILCLSDISSCFTGQFGGKQGKHSAMKLEMSTQEQWRKTTKQSPNGGSTQS